MKLIIQNGKIIRVIEEVQKVIITFYFQNN